MPACPKAIIKFTQLLSAIFEFLRKANSTIKFHQYRAPVDNRKHQASKMALGEYFKVNLTVVP